MRKNIKKLSSIVVAIFAVTLLINTTTVNATATLPAGAEPVFKSGTIIGGSKNDYLRGVDGGATNKNGITAITIAAFSSDGDFTSALALSGYTASGSSQGLIALINPDGSLRKIFAPTVGKAQSDVHSVTVDAAGNFYFVGYDYSPVTTKEIGVGTNKIPAPAGADTSSIGIVGKIDENGNLLWYNYVAGGANANSVGSVIDSNGDLVVLSTGKGSDVGNVTGAHDGEANNKDVIISRLNTQTGAYIDAPKYLAAPGHQGVGSIFFKDNVFYILLTNNGFGGIVTDKIFPRATDNDLGLLKLDMKLKPISYKAFGGKGNDYGAGWESLGFGAMTMNNTILVDFESTSTDLPAELTVSKGGTDMRYAQFDLNFNYLGGGVLGGTGNDSIININFLPSGDLLMTGQTTSTDGNFADRTASSPTGFVSYVDIASNSIKKTKYYGDTIQKVTYLSGGDFLYVGTTISKPNVPDITAPAKGMWDVWTATFGPSAPTPSFINARSITNVLLNSENKDTKTLASAVIGNFSEFLSQDTLTATPARITTNNAKTFKVVFSALNADSKTSYINVTKNLDPLISGNQLIDADTTITVLAGSGLTSEKILTMSKAAAWNMDTNEPYTITVDTADLAAVNAVTTTTTTVPVKLTIPTVTRANVTKTIQVKVMPQQELIAEIKAEAEATWGGDQSAYANSALQAIKVGTATPDDLVANLQKTTETAEQGQSQIATATTNVDTDGDGIPDYNIDLDGDGIVDLNKDTDGDGIPDSNVTQSANKSALNYDANGDGVPDTNIDVNGDGTADINIDTNADGIADINIDYDLNKTPDFNRDTTGNNVADTNLVQRTNVRNLNYDKNGDNIPDLNIDLNGDGVADLNIDLNGDGTADLNIDAIRDGVPELNIDLNNDRKADLNIDTNNDGKADINIDTNKNNKPNINVDYNSDNTADFNIDEDDDKLADINLIQSTSKTGLNYDSNNDGYPETNIDLNNDGVAELNIDKDGDGTPDLNLDKNRSGIAKLNIDKNNDGIADVDIDSNGDGVADLSLDTNGDGNADLNIDKNNDGVADINIDKNNDGKPDLNIDTNNDGNADVNIDTNNDGVADINIDTNNDNIADINIDKNNDGIADLNIDKNGDKKADINIDTNNDGNADINIDTNNDGVANINIDTNNDKKADLNIDTNNDNIADVNIDTNNDGIADLNIDTNNDNVADINIDKNNDGVADINIDTNGDKKADINIDTNNDGIADLNIDTNNDGKPDVNIDIDGDKVADVNKDTNNDGTADTNLVQSTDPAGLNYDKNGDNIPDLNIDLNGDGVADLNIDKDGDGKADLNVDTDKDGHADLNIDKDGDGIADLNIDTNKDGKADLNIDTNKDGKADLNVDMDGDGIADLNIDTNGDGKADKNIDADGDGKVDPIILPGILPGVLPTTGTAIVGTIALIIALSTYFFRKYYNTVK